MKPYVGLTVHYIDPADNAHCAAMIVALTEQELFNADTKVSTFSCQVNLVVWNGYGAHMPKEGIPYDATAKQVNTWHFIEIEAEKTPTVQPNDEKRPSSPGDSLPKPDNPTV